MLKKNKGNAVSVLMIIIIIAIIAIGVFLFFYIQSEEIEVPNFVRNFIETDQEKVVDETGNEVLKNPLEDLSNVETPHATASGYYFSQLNSYAKVIYQALESNIENLKTGTYTIKLGDQFDSILDQEDGMQQLNQIYQNAIDAFIMDHPEVFYLDITKMIMVVNTKTSPFSKTYELQISPDQNQSYLAEGFSNKQDVDNAINQINLIKNEIVANATGTDYDKIKYVHDWLVEDLNYDQTLAKPNIRNVYGAFINHEAVCEGYAEAFQMLMNEIGIPSVMVVGTGTNSNGQTESHAWNYVQLEGKWYGIDTTWDDPVVIGGGRQTSQMRMQYFLKGSTTFNESHHASGQVSEAGMIFTYPTLETSDYRS